MRIGATDRGDRCSSRGEPLRYLLGEVGYADLSIGQVATRAGVHRPAVYRRWQSKRHLIVDTVINRTRHHTHTHSRHRRPQS
ncbi:helix-turn-helix domain-containing protein [Williamsia sp. R60]